MAQEPSEPVKPSSETTVDAAGESDAGFDLPMQSLLTNNCLFLVDALGAKDLNTALRLDEDISALALGLRGKRYVHYRKVQNKEDFIDSLFELYEWCTLGVRPILHIEAHGDVDEGLPLSDSNEVIGWEELDARFREINIAAEGHLGVILSTCFGFRQLRAVSIDLPAPYAFLVGPREVIRAEATQTDLTAFFTTLLRENDLRRAVDELGSAWGFFDAQHAFAVGFAKHLEAGRSRQQTNRISDAILAQLEGQDAFLDSIPIAAKRRKIKALLREMQLDFEVYAGRFFQGRIPPVTHAQISKFVREYKMGL